MVGTVDTMDGSVFEGLFVRELKPSGPFKEELKRLGLDVDRLQSKYPESLFRRAVDVAAAQAYPGLTVHEAHFALGERAIAGYFGTILGRVTAGLIPIIGVTGTLKRVARLWQVPQPGMRISAVEQPAAWTISFENPAMTADLVAGITQAALRRADPAIACSVSERRPGGGQVLVATPSKG